MKGKHTKQDQERII